MTTMAKAALALVPSTAPAGAALKVAPTRTPEQEALIRLGLPMVEQCTREVSRRYKNLVTPEDLLAPGTLALIEAAVAYHPDRHPSFAIYARHHLRGRMLDAIRRDHFSLRARVERAMERGYEVFTAHQEPEADPFAETNETPLETAGRECDDALAAALVAGAHAARDAVGEDVVVDRLALRKALGALEAHELRVVQLVDEEQLTLDEVAREVGVSAKTAQRRHVAALQKLRRVLFS